MNLPEDSSGDVASVPCDNKADATLLVPTINEVSMIPPTLTEKEDSAILSPPTKQNAMTILPTPTECIPVPCYRSLPIFSRRLPQYLTGLPLPAMNVIVLTTTPRTINTWAASQTGSASTRTARECWTMRWICSHTTRDQLEAKLCPSSTKK